MKPCTALVNYSPHCILTVMTALMDFFLIRPDFTSIYRETVNFSDRIDIEASLTHRSTFQNSEDIQVTARYPASTQLPLYNGASFPHTLGPGFGHTPTHPHTHRHTLRKVQWFRDSGKPAKERNHFLRAWDREHGFLTMACLDIVQTPLTDWRWICPQDFPIP